MSTPPISHSALLRHASFLRRLARELVRDEHESDDVVQEAWLKALRSRGPVQRPQGWLRRIVRSVALDRRPAMLGATAGPRTRRGAAVASRSMLRWNRGVTVRAATKPCSR